jgi:hypothetical protein
MHQKNLRLLIHNQCCQRDMISASVLSERHDFSISAVRKAWFQHQFCQGDMISASAVRETWFQHQCCQRDMISASVLSERHVFSISAVRKAWFQHQFCQGDMISASAVRDRWFTFKEYFHSWVSNRKQSQAQGCLGGPGGARLMKKQVTYTTALKR